MSASTGPRAESAAERAARAALYRAWEDADRSDAVSRAGDAYRAAREHR